MADDQSGRATRCDYDKSQDAMIRAEDGGIFGGGYNWGAGRFNHSAREAGEEMLRGRHRPGSRDAD